MRVGVALTGAAAAAGYLFWTGRLDSILFPGSDKGEAPQRSAATPASPAGSAPQDAVRRDSDSAVARSLSGLAAALQVLKGLGPGGVDLVTWWGATSPSQRLTILQMARELLKATVTLGGQGAGVIDLLCPELSDGKLERLVPAVPALVRARLEDRDGVRLHDYGFVKASLNSAAADGAPAADPYTAEVLTDNRQTLMNSFLSHVLSVVARCADEAAAGRGGQLHAIPEGGTGAPSGAAAVEGEEETDEEEGGRGAAAAAAGHAGQQAPKKVEETPEEEAGRRRREFVESVEYGDV